MNHLAGDPERFYFICVETKQGRLVAVFPFEWKVIRFIFFKYYVLCLPRHAEVRMVDFIVDASYLHPEKIFVSVLDWLKRELPFRWNCVFLPGVFTHSVTAKCIVEQTEYPMLIGSCFECNIIPIHDYQSFEKRISKNFRRNLKRAHNKLKKEKNERIRRVFEHRELHGIFEKFLDVEASGWKGSKGTAIKCDRNPMGYYRGLLQSFSEMGQVEVAYLGIDNQVVVALYILVIKNTAYFYKIGYNESKGYLSPGNLLIEWLLKNYYVEGRIKYVNLITDAPYMKKWVPESRKMCNYFCFGYSLKDLFVKNILKSFFRIKKKKTIRILRRYFQT